MTNRLIDSTSPYLLQHAHNPVDWFPWGREALELAKERDKPIFLSIGYSACHWCHVMEHESFEDEATAKLLNERFVPIKVDREERPDLDEIYMTAVHILTGRGGWPMSVFLTPELKPFHAGTYFPPRDSLGMPSFRRVLNVASDVYAEKRESVQRVSTEVADAIRKATSAQGDAGRVQLSERVVEAAIARFGNSFDARWGGFGGAPKFPPSQALQLLLRRYEDSEDRKPRMMVERTLGAMARGGMYDQLGGGFHRYAVDEKWLVPHFEKMLYDNAQLVSVYLEAFRVTAEPYYERIARQTMDFMMRELRDEEGGFTSALDADSEGVEGKFYVWSLDELRELLGDEDAAFFARSFGVTAAGNFEGQSILNFPQPLAKLAEEADTTVAELLGRVDELRPGLMEERSKRIRPATDDKVLADWNALAISAFAQAYRILGDQVFRDVAEQAASFVLTEMTSAEEGLLHTWRGGKGHTPAFLDDHAFLLAALLDLYDATSEERWLVEARGIAAGLIERFWDDESGGFFTTRANQEDLIARTKGTGGGPTPAGNAVALSSLLRLSRHDSSGDFRSIARATLDAFSTLLSVEPTALPSMVLALDEYLAE